MIQLGDISNQQECDKVTVKVEDPSILRKWLLVEPSKRWYTAGATLTL